ncbi:hypothetical protein [Paenibacillus wynnii]|uniref:Uncharacterized protein n=1 Tax=Paenibacillus wynnii TaxID=268407 RepID=A0A098MC02_9BACL|nr:hypothetical protein [Paenibacillus wynnii]KGE19556.1 hypothetical protein PWYN_09550 [Paenibacillus wynnii]
MECIVHFEVQHSEGPKQLRGLLFLDKGSKPSESQLIEMFKDMKFDVNMGNREKLIFKPVNPREDYSEIRVTEFDMGDEEVKEDRELKSIIGNLLPRKPTGI